MIRISSMKALATLALLAGPFLAHGQEPTAPPKEEGLRVAAAEPLVQEPAAATASDDAAPMENSMDDSGVFSERPAPGVGVSDADINTTGEADSSHSR